MSAAIAAILAVAFAVIAGLVAPPPLRRRRRRLAFGQALPRARVVPFPRFCTWSFTRYQVSGFQVKGLAWWAV